MIEEGKAADEIFVGGFLFRNHIGRFLFLRKKRPQHWSCGPFGVNYDPKRPLLAKTLHNSRRNSLTLSDPDFSEVN